MYLNFKKKKKKYNNTNNIVVITSLIELLNLNTIILFFKEFISNVI